MKDRLELGRQYISSHIKAIRFKARHTKLTKKTLDDIATYTVLKKNKTDSISMSPNYYDACQYQLKYPEVDIKLYQLQDVYCNVEGANFVPFDQKSIYIEEFPYISCKEANYKAGLVVRHDTEYAYIKNIKQNSVKKLGTAFFLGGNGAFNFYHWIIEIAPKLLFLTDELLQRYGIDTLIVHQCVKDNDNFKWILEQCLKHFSHIKIEYTGLSDVLYVENLFLINTFNQTVYNYNTFSDEYRTLTILCQDNIKALRERLIAAASSDNVNMNTPKKVFVLRNRDGVSFYNKRDYNEQEIYEFFKQEGFVGVYPDKLSISEQISLFQNAQFVVGPTGASWSNLIFASKGMKAISWLPSQIKYFDTYCSLAGLFGVDMRFLQYKTDSEFVHSSYQLDVSLIKALYQEMQS